MAYVSPHTLIVLMFFNLLGSGNQQDCTLEKEKGDLKVYTCGSANDKLKTLRAELVLENTSFNALHQFIMDIENYVNWQYNTIEASVLKKTGEQSLVYHVVVEAPWPLSNRELVVEMTSYYDSVDHVLHITTNSVPAAYPASKDLVRVPYSEGTWRVTSQGESALKIDYTFRVNPGGYVPAWLANMAMAEGPFYSFTKMKELMRR